VPQLLLTMPICNVGGCGKGYVSLYALFLLLPRDVRECGQAAAVEEATASHVCGILKTSCLEESVAPGAHLRSISLPIGLYTACPGDGCGLSYLGQFLRQLLKQLHQEGLALLQESVEVHGIRVRHLHP
jgi:hypothetical protein